MVQISLDVNKLDEYLGEKTNCDRKYTNYLSDICIFLVDAFNDADIDVDMNVYDDCTTIGIYDLEIPMGSECFCDECLNRMCVSSDRALRFILSHIIYSLNKHESCNAMFYYTKKCYHLVLTAYGEDEEKVIPGDNQQDTNQSEVNNEDD
jgi:hypothetical protein